MPLFDYKCDKCGHTARFHHKDGKHECKDPRCDCQWFKMPKGENHHAYKIDSDKHPRAKKVINTKTKEVYGSVKTLAENLNVNEITLRAKLNGTDFNNTDYLYLVDYENNNGWIRIENVKDIKFKTNKAYVYNEKMTVWNKVVYVHEILPLYYDGKITHYQPIIKPQPPIY